MDEMTRTISIIDLIVDVPGWQDLRAVEQRLLYSKINGHNVLHVQQSAIHHQDAVDIPHPGHNYKCDTDPEGCAGKSMANGRRYKRYFFLQAIVDGAFRLAEMEHTDFRLDSTMVMLSSVTVKVQPDEYNRIELEPWIKELRTQ